MKLICNRFGALLVVASCLCISGAAMGQVGTVVAWGAGTTNSGATGAEYGQCIIPDAALSGVTQIAGGYGHTIALKDGAVLAWGWNSYGQCTVPDSANSGVSAIAGGHGHTIALKGGAVLAWGRSGEGQCFGTDNLGNPILSADIGQPVQILGQTLTGISAIAAGYSHTIALKAGAVLAWGRNNEGQCTVPDTASSGVTAIAAGYIHTIALKDGAVLAWGLNENGQCTIPASANSGVSAIASGWYHTIALKAGAVLAWGNNGLGQCTIPAAGQSGATAIAGGCGHTIVINPIATITGVLPISGPSSGGTHITITGTNFVSPATVTIGGAPATHVVVVSDTQITATTPAGFPGPALVTVNLGSSTAFYYRPSCGSDVDNNGVVDSADLGIVLLDFGNCSESLTTPQEQEPLIFQSVEPATPVLNKR